MRRIVAPRELLVVSQFRLHQIELLLADNRWDLCHRDPLLGWSTRMPSVLAAYGSQRGVQHP